MIFVILLGLELAYFRVARHFNIIDRPNERSSHSVPVIRGGGIIFVLGVWIWSLFFGFEYPWMLSAVTLASVVSFIDDVHALPKKVRLTAHFVAMYLMFVELGILNVESWRIAIVMLIVSVGAINIYNFMDGINGITGGYSLVVLASVRMLNVHSYMNTGSILISHSLHNVMVIALLIFCFFNFRPRGRARCFAGDVGSIGIAFISVFAVGRLIISKGDMSWLAFLLVYGVDGCMTIVHRIMLHENLGVAHRKHAYQIMANELGMSHLTVSLIYMGLQLAVSAAMIYLVPDTKSAHWIYLGSVSVVLVIAYVLFMKKYYHLHEEYLASLSDR